MADRLRDEILKQFCYHREQLLLVVGLLGVFLVLSIIGTQVITPGTSAHVVNTMNVVGLSGFFAVFGVLVVYCYRSDRVYQ